MNLEGTGIDPAALERYVQEQVYSLPGTDRHRDAFSVLLTGSRGTDKYTPKSDVDIDVLCPQAVYEQVNAASLEAGIIKSPLSFFCILKGDDWDRYYGKAFGRPHFSLTSLEAAEGQIASYEDVPLWIWTNARVLSDPGGQFRKVRDQFDGYPQAVLDKKIKYRWMMAAYWEVDCYPYHHGEDSEALLPAGAAVLNAVNELLRFFFLVEGKPFPYAEQLLTHAEETSLGRRFCPLLREAAELAVGARAEDRPPWERLDRAIHILSCSGLSEQEAEFENACFQAMIDAGVDPEWVEADYQNIEELLLGWLGPLP